MALAPSTANSLKCHASVLSPVNGLGQLEGPRRNWLRLTWPREERACLCPLSSGFLFAPSSTREPVHSLAAFSRSTPEGPRFLFVATLEKYFRVKTFKSIEFF